MYTILYFFFECIVIIEFSDGPHFTADRLP